MKGHAQTAPGQEVAFAALLLAGDPGGYGEQRSAIQPDDQPVQRMQTHAGSPADP